jgi:hypothetical protein
MSFPLWPKEHKRRGEHVRISDSRPFELVAAKGAKSGGPPLFIFPVATNFEKVSRQVPVKMFRK